MRTYVIVFLLMILVGCQPVDIEQDTQNVENTTTQELSVTHVEMDSEEKDNNTDSIHKEGEEEQSKEGSGRTNESSNGSSNSVEELIPFKIVDIATYKDYDIHDEWDSWSVFRNRYSYLGYIHTDDTSHYYDPNEVFFYSSAAANDYNLNTAWVEGVEGYGKGETISYTVNPSEESLLETVDIINGYTKTEALWHKNSRVKTLEMRVEGESYLLHLEDSMDVQRFKLPDIEMGSETLFQFTIKEVYEGDVYEDTAISEIHFTGTRSNIKSCILEQGVFFVNTNILDTDNANSFYISDNNFDLTVTGSRPIDRASLELLMNEDSNLSNEQWNIEWLDDKHAIVNITGLEEMAYYIHFGALKDTYGLTLFPSMSNEYGMVSSIHFSIKAQNRLSKISLLNGNVIPIENDAFSNIVYTPKAIHPFNGDLIYLESDFESEGMTEYTPLVYKGDKHWERFAVEETEYPNSGDEIRFLGSDFLLHTKHLYNSAYEYIKTLDVEGIVVGSAQSPATNDFYIFAGEFRQPMTVYVYDASMSNLKETFTVPVAYFYDGCSCHLYGMPINVDFIDNERIAFDGWDLHGEMGYEAPVSVYTVNISSKDVLKVIDNGEIRASLGEGYILLASKIGTYPFTLTYEIVNMNGEKQFEVEPLEFENMSSGDNYYYYEYLMDVYHTDTHITFAIENEVYIYSRLTGEIQRTDYDSSVKLLGIYDGYVYVNY